MRFESYSEKWLKFCQFLTQNYQKTNHKQKTNDFFFNGFLFWSLTVSFPLLLSLYGKELEHSAKVSFFLLLRKLKGEGE